MAAAGATTCTPGTLTPPSSSRRSLGRLGSIPENGSLWVDSDDEESLTHVPPRLSRTGSGSAATRQLFAGRSRGLARAGLPGRRVALALSASAAATALLLLSMTASMADLELRQDGGLGGAAAGRRRKLIANRLLLAGSQGAASQGGAARLFAEQGMAQAAGLDPQQQRPQLWNVSLLLHVGGADAAQLAGPLREPFLQALMPAAAAAGGVEVVAAATHWYRRLPAPQPAAAAARADGAGGSEPGAAVSASLLLSQDAAQRLAAAFAARPQLQLMSRSGAWQGPLAVTIKLVDSAAAKCLPSAQQGSQLHALLGCPSGNGGSGNGSGRSGPPALQSQQSP